MRESHNGLDLVGQKFGRLLVVSRAANTKAGMRRWVCQCDCGGTTVTTGAKLRSGHTKSCGCLNKERITKHGMHKSAEYIVYQQMKERCFNTKKGSYTRYGAKGITVCERWRVSFENFYEDMGPRPPGTSLDRIDNAGNYEPGNCRWADNATQYRNRAQTVWITYNGETKCRKDWAKQYGVDEATLAQRLARGWDIEKALTTKPMNSGGGRRGKSTKLSS